MRPLKKTSNQDTVVLTSFSLGQYGKVQVQDFPTKTEDLRLISCSLYGFLLCFGRPVLVPWTLPDNMNNALESEHACQTECTLVYCIIISAAIDTNHILIHAYVHVSIITTRGTDSQGKLAHSDWFFLSATLGQHYGIVHVHVLTSHSVNKIS